MQYYPAITLRTYCTNIFATNTITIPTIAALTVLVAFSTLSASPAEVINMYPATTNIMTATTAANITKKFIAVITFPLTNVSIELYEPLETQLDNPEISTAASMLCIYL